MASIPSRVIDDSVTLGTVRVAQIGGVVAPGFEPVAAAFAENFQRGAEIGAAVCVYRAGRPVVDLWGGVADPTTGRPAAWNSRIAAE